MRERWEYDFVWCLLLLYLECSVIFWWRNCTNEVSSLWWIRSVMVFPWSFVTASSWKVTLYANLMRVCDKNSRHHVRYLMNFTVTVYCVVETGTVLKFGVAEILHGVQACQEGNLCRECNNLWKFRAWFEISIYWW